MIEPKVSDSMSENAVGLEILEAKERPMAGGDSIDDLGGVNLPAAIPGLEIRCVEELFNAAYHMRLNGVAISGYAGRSAGGGAAKNDLERSITKLAGKYIQWSLSNPSAPPLDAFTAKQLYQSLEACRDAGVAMRLDIVVMNGGSNNGHIEYALYSSGRPITANVTLNTKPYPPSKPGGDGSILARTQGVSGHVTYALSIGEDEGKPIWMATELERNSYTPRIVGMWL